MNENVPNTQTSAPTDPATREQTGGEYGNNEFRLEVDPDNPGDHVTTHPEDDDPQSLSGGPADDNTDTPQSAV